MSARVFWFLLLPLLLLAACATGDDDDSGSAGEGEFDDDADDDATTDDDTSDDDADDDTAAEPWSIDRAALRDKMLGSWVGQMAGVTWGASTEFNYHGRIIPEDEVPEWQPRRINGGFIQDDLYVEIPFVDAMVSAGPTASWTVFGEFFRDTLFPLWHANKAGRDNLREGIPAPDSGHYSHNQHADDIDWQIEADFIGAICPGRPNAAVDIAWRAGHVMNYGDGVYGGVFLSAMHAAAFFAESLDKIIEAGRQALPVGSKYRRVVEDVLQWHADGLAWEETWQELQDKWGDDDRCPSYDNPLMQSYNIDAKLNGAYVLIGLLYGAGDFTESMRIAMRCGQDSDCNPSSVGGILGNWYGLAGIPDQYKSALDSTKRFLFTQTTLDDAIDQSLILAQQIIESLGGAVEGTGDAQQWSIPQDVAVAAPILEQWPVEENDAPNLSAQIVSQVGLTVELQATATDAADGIGAYEWYFGDLQRANGSSVSHTYAAPGSHEIIVYVTDGVGNTSWQTLPVTVTR